MARLLDLTAWLREQCGDFRFTIGGIFQRRSDMAQWPLFAANPEELERRLVEGGHLLPLPKEPAALANVLEVSIVDFLLTRASAVDRLEVQRGNERGYPDMEFGGPALGGSHYAVDVKAARRSARGTRTQSRITLYTGNTYFRWPDLHWPGTLRAFNSYAAHLDLIMIYSLNPVSRARVEDLEVIVQEPWRIASTERSSTTREYIGAVDEIKALRNGQGSFRTPREFYEYWRRYPFKVSSQVQRQLQRALDQTRRELEQLRADQSNSD